jgi:hypothetical protein
MALLDHVFCALTFNLPEKELDRVFGKFSQEKWWT